MLEPGQIFAERYRIIRPLAVGGMGAVYIAEHTGTERRVALKLMLPHVGALEGAREKFDLEARIAARVDSEHIVAVLDAGFDESTRSLYLVMELLSGDTLTTLVKSRGPLPPATVVELMRQTARGLDAAHRFKDARGNTLAIVHRDLKPDNLFLAQQRDGSSRVKILDFGIAKVLSDSTNQSQLVRGTPLYMAFEQVTAGVLSPQTDIWALGLITYFLLTGRSYWRTPDKPDAGVQSLFAEIITLPLVPPSARLREQQANVALPAAFDAWLLRCIDREPRQRFASAGEAAESLAHVLGTNAATSRSQSEASVSALQSSRTDTFEAPRAGLTTGASLAALSNEPVQHSARGRSLLFWSMAAAGAGVLGLVGALFWISRSDTDAVPARPASAAVAPLPPAKDAAKKAPVDNAAPASTQTASARAVHAPPAEPVATAAPPVVRPVSPAAASPAAASPAPPAATKPPPSLPAAPTRTAAPAVTPKPPPAARPTSPSASQPAARPTGAASSPDERPSKPEPAKRETKPAELNPYGER